MVHPLITWSWRIDCWATCFCSMEPCETNRGNRLQEKARGKERQEGKAGKRGRGQEGKESGMRS